MMCSGELVETDVSETARALVRSSDTLFRRFLATYRLSINICMGSTTLGQLRLFMC